MPSFFYHIAFDLHHGKTNSPIKTNHISALQITEQDHKESHSLEQPVLLGSENTSCDINGGPLPHETLLTDDWRYNRIKIQNIKMSSTVSESKRSSRGESTSAIVSGIIAGHDGFATKGRFEPVNRDDKDLGWGVIRLFRDADETPGLYEDTVPSKSKGGRGTLRRGGAEEQHFHDEDCSTLCILAVPSYFTPSDFLGFVGEKTRDEVSHFRMIRTERGNRYMVLMKFRNGKKARDWRKEWNGKPFDSMEPENCHVVFVKSIEYRLPDVASYESFPDMSNDPFTPVTTINDAQSTIATAPSTSSLPSSTRNTKPLAPPTPSLIELPTCPVCLERMDESTGLLTILCQHVFHCTCLQKWRGSGCPVCRYTQDGLNKRKSMTGEETGLNECSICRSDANLWICLICGSVGCGRYDAAHAFLHYQQTSHSFAMDLDTQRVWDYATDAYVHRLVQDKADGKFVDLPASAADTQDSRNHGDAWDEEDYVPREKLDNIGREYTHLLTSQLESQRTYFSEALERAADKASQAAQAAESAKTSASEMQEQLTALKLSHETLAREIVPGLEKEKDRASKRAERFEAMARKLEKEWREEKTVSGSLMERIKWLEGKMQTLTAEKVDLEEQNRDLSIFISSGEKLKQLEGVNEEELKEGSTTIPDPQPAEKGKKGKGKGKK